MITIDYWWLLVVKPVINHVIPPYSTKALPPGVTCRVAHRVAHRLDRLLTDLTEPARVYSPTMSSIPASKKKRRMRSRSLLYELFASRMGQEVPCQVYGEIWRVNWVNMNAEVNSVNSEANWDEVRWDLWILSWSSKWHPPKSSALRFLQSGTSACRKSHGHRSPCPRVQDSTTWSRLDQDISRYIKIQDYWWIWYILI